MNGNRNQSATGKILGPFVASGLYPHLLVSPRLTPRSSECLQKESNLQPSGNECLSGAVEPGQHGRKTPENTASTSEHRAKSRAKIATERQS